MKTKKQLISDALELAKKNVPPAPKHLEVSLQKGKELAEVYHADYDIVIIGICLMDIKLKEAIAQSKQGEHVAMSLEFAKEFLKDYDITEDEYNKIINSVEAHHDTVPFQCIEAEVCANADCYRFLAPACVFTFSNVLSKRDVSLKEQLQEMKHKLEEKHSILSLNKAKEDLEEDYQMFLKLLEEALNDI